MEKIGGLLDFRGFLYGKFGLFGVFEGEYRFKKNVDFCIDDWVLNVEG